MNRRTIVISGLVATLTTAACANSTGTRHGGRTSRTDPAGAATVSVRIAMYGGPMQPDGHMAMTGQPAPTQPVQLRDARGRVWPGTTGASGVAAFTVPAGRYRVSSSYCGVPAWVTVAAGASRAVALQCDVP